jgi:uncharacterized protein (TIGR03905 family)
METYRTKGSTCSRQIIYEVENGVLKDLKFVGGCSGNLQGIAQLVIGMNIKDVIDKLKGIKCKGNTSCPDQLSCALSEYLARTEAAATAQ